jgi:branched-subunit amino acid aminotransferase/4-amino-4-deoxychorismate lyase
VAGEQYDDVLFTTPDGLVTEATRSNVFAVIGGQLCTPKRHMLLGITRHVVLKLATQLGLNPQERDVTVADLAEATEVFTTGSIAELVPAGSLNDRPLPYTMDGPVFSRLRAAFTAEIAAHTTAHQHVYQRATAKAA